MGPGAAQEAAVDRCGHHMPPWCSREVRGEVKVSREPLPYLGKHMQTMEPPPTGATTASHAEAGTKGKRVVAVFLVGQVPLLSSLRETPQPLPAAPAEGRHGARSAEQPELRRGCIFRLLGGNQPAPEKDN